MQKKGVLMRSMQVRYIELCQRLFRELSRINVSQFIGGSDASEPVSLVTGCPPDTWQEQLGFRRFRCRPGTGRIGHEPADRV